MVIHLTGKDTHFVYNYFHIESYTGFLQIMENRESCGISKSKTTKFGKSNLLMENWFFCEQSSILSSIHANSFMIHQFWGVTF